MPTRSALGQAAMSAGVADAGGAFFPSISLNEGDRDGGQRL